MGRESGSRRSRAPRTPGRVHETGGGRSAAPEAPAERGHVDRPAEAGTPLAHIDPGIVRTPHLGLHVSGESSQDRHPVQGYDAIVGSRVRPPTPANSVNERWRADAASVNSAVFGG